MATAPPAFFSRISIGPVASPFRGDLRGWIRGCSSAEEPDRVWGDAGFELQPAAPAATPKLYDTPTDALIAQTVSDASPAITRYSVSLYGPFYVVAYLLGSPDVAGTTINTLIAV